MAPSNVLSHRAASETPPARHSIHSTHMLRACPTCVLGAGTTAPLLRGPRPAGYTQVCARCPGWAHSHKLTGSLRSQGCDPIHRGEWGASLRTHAQGGTCHEHSAQLLKWPRQPPTHPGALWVPPKDYSAGGLSGRSSWTQARRDSVPTVLARQS